MTLLLGGDASPFGWSVQYLDAPLEAVLDATVDIHNLHNKSRVKKVGEFPGSLNKLLPFESPWTRELLMPAGRWTAYLNNDIDGGDPTALGHAIALRLKVRCVVATNAPRHGPGHASTQLWVIGPDGKPPLMYERTITADAADGRWKWLASGEPFKFESQERYSERMIRKRFDRELLLDYLDKFDIPARTEDYGPGVLVQQKVAWKRKIRTLTLEQERTRLAPE